jgi:hypothetical protein
MQIVSNPKVFVSIVAGDNPETVNGKLFVATSLIGPLPPV